MSQQEEALRYLLGLESFPSFYEISQATDEELEERVSNWQEQIFNLAGEVQELKAKLKTVEQENNELKIQKQKVEKELYEFMERQKYIPAMNASQLLRDNQAKQYKQLDTVSTQVKQLRNAQKTDTQRLFQAKSLDFKQFLRAKSDFVNGTDQSPTSPQSEHYLLDMHDSKGRTRDIQELPTAKDVYEKPKSLDEIPSESKSDQNKEPADINDGQKSLRTSHVLVEDELKEALETISRLELKLCSQQEYYEDLLQKELAAKEKFYQELLEKKSYLPTSFENLEESATEDLTFVVDGSHKFVKSGSILKLVDYLADPVLSDVRFLQIFIFSYPMYTDAKTLLKMILGKLNQIKDTNEILKISRLINVLKYWIDNFFEDFERDSSLIGKLTSQLSILKKTNPLSGMSEMILKQMDRKMTRVKHANEPLQITAPVKTITSQLLKKVASIKNKNNKGILFYTPEEVAKQLTLLDFKLFSSINIREFLELNWMKKENKSLSPGITAFINWSNHVSFWVTSEILLKKSVKERVKIMEFMISLAHQLEKLSNFHGMSNVLSGINTSPIYRLRKTKDNLSSKFVKMQESLEQVTSTDLNYKKFRQAISVSQPPLIPFLGIYQGDLVFLDSTGNTMLDNNIVNYQKVYRMASHVIDLKIYQNHPYFFTIIPEIQDYITKYCPLSEEDAYAVSLTCEPRV